MRRRYLGLALDSEQPVPREKFIDAAWAAITRLYGECGASKADLRLIDYDEEEGLAIVRTGHTEVEMVRAALATVTKIADKPAAVHVQRVSGTIRALKEKTGRRR